MTEHTANKLAFAAGISSRPIAYAIEEIPAVTGISRTKVFQAVRDRKLIIRKYGRTSIALHEDLVAFLKSLPAKGTGVDVAA